MSVYAELAPAASMSIPMITLMVSAGVIGLTGSAIVGTAKGIYTLLAYENETLKPVTPETPPSTNFQTFFTDSDLLKKTLDASGIAYQVKSGKFIFDYQGNHFEFFKGENENFELKIDGQFNLDKINEFYNDLAHSYEKFVQEQICSNIREKVKNNKAFKIEQEEVLEDESVVITISV